MSSWIKVYGMFNTYMNPQELKQVMGTPFTEEEIYRGYPLNDNLSIQEQKEMKERVSENHKQKWTLIKRERELNSAVPYGSEGTLNYNIYSISTNQSQVIISGSLRDVEEHTQVINWIKRIIKKCDVRNLYVNITGGIEAGLTEIKSETGDYIIISNSYTYCLEDNLKEEE